MAWVGKFSFGWIDPAVGFSILNKLKSCHIVPWIIDAAHFYIDKIQIKEIESKEYNYGCETGQYKIISAYLINKRTKIVQKYFYSSLFICSLCRYQLRSFVLRLFAISIGLNIG